jgi:cysteinyl-tRNA synthetase
MTNYKEPIDFSVARLREAEAVLDKWYLFVGDGDSVESDVRAGIHVELPDTFISAMLDDLNTTAAIAALSGQIGAAKHVAQHQKIEGKRSFRLAARSLGLLERRAADWFRERNELGSGISEEEIEARKDRRLAFIAEKNWAEADKIRDELLTQGIQLKDGKDPTTGERITTWEVKR